MEWPRLPLPGWPDGNGDGDPSGAADELAASAARGRQLAALLDSDTPVAGVTDGALMPAMAAIAVPSTTDGGNMAGDDFAVTAGWGHHGSGDAVMPGQGRVVERDYTPAERAALSDVISALGATTYDVYLERAGVLAQRAGRRLELPPGRLPGPQKVAILPRAARAGPAADGGGGAGVRGDGA